MADCIMNQKCYEQLSKIVLVHKKVTYTVDL